MNSIATLARTHNASKKIGYAAISAGSLFFAFSLVDFGLLGETLFAVRPDTMILGTALILISAVLSLVRFRSVLGGFGYQPGWRDTFVAFSLGQASNLIFLNIIGQSLSRAAVLSKANVPTGVSVVVTYWERGLAAATLLLFSMVGGWFLLTSGILDLQTAAAYLVYVFGSMAVVGTIVAVSVLGWAQTKRWAAAGLRMWPSVVLTLLSQIFMLSAYLLILSRTGGEPLSLAIVSAITVIMFAASLPISFSGWGVRELTAVQILGAVGLASSVSVTTAIAIGLISLIVLVVFGLLGVWLFVRRRESAAAPGRNSTIEWAELTALLIAVVASVLIYFQVRVAISGATVTANVADVIALTALGLIAVRRRAIFPRLFSSGLLAISLIFALALYIGWSRYGLNQWAIVNRGVGWIIILGYLAIGGALANRHGLVLRCFALAGASVAGIELALLLASLLNVSFPADTFIYPLRGYAGNSNAFSLQMIVAAIAAVTAYRLGFASRRMLRVVLVVTALATFYSLSRSGLAAYLGAVFLFVVISTPEERRERLFDGLIVVAVVFAAFASPHIMSAIAGLASQIATIIPQAATDNGFVGNVLGFEIDRNVLAHMDFTVQRQGSDTERWQSIAQGWTLWQQYPLFGAGLGAFVQHRFDANLPMLVIHSVPVWILAELGIAGFAVIGAVFVGLLGLSVKMLRDTEYFAWGAGLLVLLAVLAVSGSVHDFFFQRSFWFALGIFVGVCGKAGFQIRASHEPLALREPSIKSRSPAMPPAVPYAP